jgi:hypothetical protein
MGPLPEWAKGLFDLRSLALHYIDPEEAGKGKNFLDSG